MRTKRCSWGRCNSDSRYGDRPHMEGVTFHCFPKPTTRMEDCLQWIKMCGRPHEQLNVSKITPDKYVCSKHWLDGKGPTRANPDPLPANPLDTAKCPVPNLAASTSATFSKSPSGSTSVPVETAAWHSETKEKKLPGSMELPDVPQQLSAAVLKFCQDNIDCGGRLSVHGNLTVITQHQTIVTFFSKKLPPKEEPGAENSETEDSISKIAAAEDRGLAYVTSVHSSSNSEIIRDTEANSVTVTNNEASTPSTEKQVDSQPTPTPPPATKEEPKTPKYSRPQTARPSNPSLLRSKTKAAPPPPPPTKVVMLAPKAQVKKPAGPITAPRGKQLAAEAIKAGAGRSLLLPRGSVTIKGLTSAVTSPTLTRAITALATAASASTVVAPVVTTATIATTAKPAVPVVPSVVPPVFIKQEPIDNWMEYAGNTNNDNQNKASTSSSKVTVADPDAYKKKVLEAATDTLDVDMLKKKVLENKEVFAPTKTGPMLRPKREAAQLAVASLTTKSTTTSAVTKVLVKGQSLFKCSLCSKVFTNARALGEHNRVHAKTAMPGKYFECDTCGKKFSRYHHLQRHMAIHTGLKPYQCDQCYKSFARPDHLKVHLKRHVCDKFFCCDRCNKTFSHLTHLTMHMKLHKDKEVYTCEVCGKVFAFKSIYLTHKKTHTASDKPFKCDICGKTFRQKYYLDQHARSHTGKGERPFKCETCGKQFATASILFNHRKIHTGLKPFHCDICDKRFLRKSHLDRHKMIHKKAATAKTLPKKKEEQKENDDEKSDDEVKNEEEEEMEEEEDMDASSSTKHEEEEEEGEEDDAEEEGEEDDAEEEEGESDDDDANKEEDSSFEKEGEDSEEEEYEEGEEELDDSNDKGENPSTPKASSDEDE